jgi:penicillin-binding protein 2
LWYFQVVKGPELTQRAEMSNRARVESLAPRGLIYDRSGVVIAGIRSKLVVTAQPGLIKEHPETLDRLAEILAVPVAKLADKVKAASYRPFIPTGIFVGASVQQASKIAELGSELPGIDVQSQPMRFYPDPRSFAHLLGYVWIPYEEDVTRVREFGREPAAYVGKTGIEKVYEEQLMGTVGRERLEVDAKRHPIRVVGREAAIPGSQLTLTIDKNLQQIACKMFAERGFKGGAAAIDPQTGEILCLASAPTFDSTQFLQGISGDEYRKILADPSTPLVNRSISGGAAPGSTFKLVTTIAAMQAGKFDPNWTVVCGGGYRVGNRVTKCLGVHGSENFYEALAHSCNTYFAALAVKAGLPAMQRAAVECGIGQRVGIDTTGEWRGRYLNDDLVKRYRGKVQYYPGDVVNFGIGQGELTVTPLQMATVMAIIGSRGLHYRPHLVKAIRPPDANGPIPVQPEVINKIEATDQFWDTMMKGLVGVVENGTARAGKLPWLTWGGKTGSAEHGKFNEKKSHSWFVGVAPSVNPKIAVCVWVDSGGHGSTAAMPIAQAIITSYLKSLNPANASVNTP